MSSNSSSGESSNEPTFSYDAPQFFDFNKAKYQRYLKTLEKVLFPNSTSMSPLNPNTPLAILGNTLSSDEREDALWFQKVHAEHEGFPLRSPPHPLITPSPLPKPKRLLGTPRRVSSSTTSHTPQSHKSVADDSFRFSNPKYLRSPPKFSPVAKSPLNYTENPLMLTEFLDKTPIGKEKTIASFLDFEASPSPVPVPPKHSKTGDERFYDATPLESPTKENQRDENHLLSYSPSPPVLATKLISSSHTPISPLDSKREKANVFASKAQRVLVGVNLNSRKRRSSRGLDDDFKFGDSEHAISNVSTPSKTFGNELKRTKVAALDFCPPPARQTFNILETKRKLPLGNNKVSTEDLKRLLNEHNQRIRPRLNSNNNKRTMM